MRIKLVVSSLVLALGLATSGSVWAGNIVGGGVCPITVGPNTDLDDLSQADLAVILSNPACASIAALLDRCDDRDGRDRDRRDRDGRDRRESRDRDSDRRKHQDRDGNRERERERDRDRDGNRHRSR